MFSISPFLNFSISLFLNFYVTGILFFREEAVYAVGAEHLPEGGYGPAGSEDVVVEAFAVVTIVPGGVLHYLGVVAALAYVEHVVLCGHELEHGCLDDVGES